MSSEIINDATEVLTRLQAGQELRNRGTGWWIGMPRKPYAAHHAKRVADEVVLALEAAGRLKVSVPGVTAIAEIAPSSV